VTAFVLAFCVESIEEMLLRSALINICASIKWTWGKANTVGCGVGPIQWTWGKTNTVGCGVRPIQLDVG